MSMAVQLPHPLKSTTEDDSTHICQPHIKNINQSAFFHLKNISRLQLCISDPPLTSNTAAEFCLAVPTNPRILQWELSSKACSTSTPTIIITRWLPVKSRLLQTPPTRVTILLLIIPQISSNYTPHPAWISRIKGNDRKWADSTWQSQATLSVCWLLFILHLCICEVFSSFQARFDEFQRWDAPQQPPSERFKWFVYFKATGVRLHLWL